MNQRIAVFPGSFDPITVGHESVVRRALGMFDKIIIGIGQNAEKKYLFPIEKRKMFIEKIFENENKIEILVFEGLTVEFCRKNQIAYILRGLRTSADFEFERAIAQMNKTLLHNVDTVFLLTLPEHSFVSSTIVRELLRYKGDISHFVPKSIQNLL